MDILKRIKKFTEYILKKAEVDETFRRQGGCPLTLIAESGIDLGNEKAQLSAMDFLLEGGFIDTIGALKDGAVTAETRILPKSRLLTTFQQDWIDCTKKEPAGNYKRRYRQLFSQMIKQNYDNWKIG